MFAPAPSARIALACLAFVLLALTATADGDGPALDWDKTTHDFGNVGQHEEHEATFRYSNPSDNTVTGIRAVADCGCYGVTLSASELAPRAEGTLTVRFRTLAFSGRVKKNVSVIFDDGKKRSVRLALTLAVRSGIVVEPGRLHFGEVLAGSRPSGSINALYYDGIGKPFKITRVMLPKGDFLPARPTPYRDDRDPKWRGWRIPLAFSRPLEKGLYSRRAVLETDDEEHPRITISISATVVGKVWVRQPRIYLGMVPRGTERTTHTIVRAFDPSIELGKIQVRAKGDVLRVTIEPVPGEPGHFRLDIVVPKDAPAGRIDDVIEVLTDLPDEPVTEVKVKGRVVERRGG